MLTTKYTFYKFENIEKNKKNTTESSTHLRDEHFIYFICGASEEVEKRGYLFERR